MNGYHTDTNRYQIKEVWADNLEEEFERIRDVVERYQYIAMDTEFPGIVARPTETSMEYNYQTVKCNVDLLKVIQLGITFADSHGNLADGTSTWQFNFAFDLGQDMYAQDSIDFLKDSGLDFEKQQKNGISLQDFGELIMSSGLVINEDVKWISFHGSYDFGYLLKLLTCAPLPHSEAQFFELLHDFFPALYDIKFLLKNVRTLNINGGHSLQKIADHLNVERIGRQHQAGSDSLVTCRTFFKLMETYFNNQIDDSKYSGVIYGLGAAAPSKHPRNNTLEITSVHSGVATTSSQQQENEKQQNTAHLASSAMTTISLENGTSTTATSYNYHVGVLNDTMANYAASITGKNLPPSAILSSTPLYNMPTSPGLSNSTAADTASSFFGRDSLSSEELSKVGGRGTLHKLQQQPGLVTGPVMMMPSSQPHLGTANPSSHYSLSSSTVQKSLLISGTNAAGHETRQQHMQYTSTNGGDIGSSMNISEQQLMQMRQQHLPPHIRKLHWDMMSHSDEWDRRIVFDGAAGGTSLG